MKIVIRSYLAGSHLLEQEPNTWKAIVVLDSKLKESGFVKSKTVDHLYLRFDDVVKDRQNKRMPTEQDIQQALEFAEQAEHLVVCCRAGQARSAAIAFAICFQQNGAKAAYELLNPKRHSPNSLIIDLAAGIVDDPDFLTTFEKWRSDHAGIKMTDFLDEIERELDDLEHSGAKNRILA